MNRSKTTGTVSIPLSRLRRNRRFLMLLGGVGDLRAYALLAMRADEQAADAAPIHDGGRAGA